MKKRKAIIETIKLFTLSILYYLVGPKDTFLYVLSLSLYNIFAACFKHITLTNSLRKISSNHTKLKLYQYLVLAISVIALLFLLIGICISDIINILLNINDILLIFIAMGLTIITKPLVRITTEYFENINNNSRYYILNDVYDILDNFLLLIIALFTFKVFKINSHTATALLYLAKIIAAAIVIVFMYLISSKKKNTESYPVEKINYWQETKKILVKDSYRSLIGIIKHSYYYISIIILYLILSTRYAYATDLITQNISFIYLFALGLINYLIYIIDEINKDLPDSININSKIFNNFKVILPLTIIFCIISPLSCKVIFNAPHYSIYLTMVNFMGIFILLYELTFENINHKRIMYFSLFSGIIAKIVLIIPLINSFYRMGYNLIYGDIISTIIGLFISVIINTIYLKKINKNKENYFDRILDVLYRNILLCIILILLQFIIPIDAGNYFKSIGIMLVYLTISAVFLKLKRKRRG